MTTFILDLDSPAFIRNPYPTYQELLESKLPVLVTDEDPLGAVNRTWFFVDYNEVERILKTPSFLTKVVEQADTEASVSVMRDNLVNTDPPQHTRLRSLVSRKFSGTSLQRMSGRIRKIARDHLDAVPDKSQADFISDVAQPFPVSVIAEMFGVPESDFIKIFLWAQKISPGADSKKQYEGRVLKEKHEAVNEFCEYLTYLFEKKRREPEDDLISYLVHVQDSSGGLSRDELLSMCVFTLIAGHETTTNLLGNGLYTLLNHPEEWERLKCSENLMQTVIEELLRFEGPLHISTYRKVKEDVVFNDHLLRKGDQVCGLIAAANRDPDMFDWPHRFIIDRKPNKHLGFGAGYHYCLGAGLARMETAIMLSEIIATYPDLILMEFEEEWHLTSFFRGLRSLPVSLVS